MSSARVLSSSVINDKVPIFGQLVKPQLRITNRHHVQMRSLGEIVAGNIETLQKKSSLNWRALQQKSGISQSTITRWRSQESSPTLGKVQSIARALNVNVWQLFFDGSQSAARGIAENPLPYGYARIARLDVEASAGPGTEAPAHPDIIEHIDISSLWMRDVLGVSDSEHLRVISTRGDSMSPTINNADLAFIDISKREFTGDAIYAITWYNQLMIKRLQGTTDGRISIVSDNHAYPPQIASAADASDLYICGRVVGWWTLRRY